MVWKWCPEILFLNLNLTVLPRELTFWEIAHPPSFFTCHVMCHVSCVRCHVPCVTFQVSCVILLLFCFLKNCGGWRVCYQRGLPRLDFTESAPRKCSKFWRLHTCRETVRNHKKMFIQSESWHVRIYNKNIVPSAFSHFPMDYRPLVQWQIDNIG